LTGVAAPQGLLQPHLPKTFAGITFIANDKSNSNFFQYIVTVIRSLPFITVSHRFFTVNGKKNENFFILLLTFGGCLRIFLYVQHI